MAARWDGQHLPYIIEWLVNLHGETAVAGVLGVYYQGMRTGALQLASVDPAVAQTVIELVQAAVAAGEALPIPPEPVADTQPVPESPADGDAQEVEGEPHHRSGGPPAAPPTIQEEMPEYIRFWGMERYFAELPKRQLEFLRSLRNSLLEQENPRRAAKSLSESIHVARRKTEHLLITRYDERIEISLAPDKPLKLQEALLCRWIKKMESKIEEEIKLAGKSRLRMFFRGKPVTAEEVIQWVLKKGSKKIGDALLEDILRQGREGCDHHHHHN